jgi:hypothetical protein
MKKIRGEKEDKVEREPSTRRCPNEKTNNRYTHDSPTNLDTQEDPSIYMFIHVLSPCMVIIMVEVKIIKPPSLGLPIFLYTC